jgi:hypothetical protein
MFRFGFRRPIAKSRVSVGSKGKGDLKETFVDDYWQNGVSSLYQDIQKAPSLNPGQQAILEQNQEEIFSFLFDVGEDYDPDEFIGYLQNILDGGKYEALSETWDDYATELENVWDHATGGDGYQEKKFLGVVYK